MHAGMYIQLCVYMCTHVEGKPRIPGSGSQSISQNPSRAGFDVRMHSTVGLSGLGGDRSKQSNLYGVSVGGLLCGTSTESIESLKSIESIKSAESIEVYRISRIYRISRTYRILRIVFWLKMHLFKKSFLRPDSNSSQKVTSNALVDA